MGAVTGALAALRRAVAASVSGDAAPGAPPPEPQPARLVWDTGAWRCPACDVAWSGGPRCWCCGRNVGG